MSEPTDTPKPTETPEPIVPTPTPTEVPPLNWEQLKNATYLMPTEMEGPEDGQIPLEAGEFSWTPVPGSASVEQYLLYPGVAWGDLNGDGVEDAVVVLINVSAGSGNFYHLVPVLNEGGEPRPLNPRPYRRPGGGGAGQNG